jgi:predicted dehydrogenase
MAVAAGAPAILPASVFGADAPSNRITVGCIGVGRMGMADLQDMIGRDGVQIIAVCDVDANRLRNAKEKVESYYATRSVAGHFKGCATYGDYRDLIGRPEIDVVQIVTPDHWHALPSIEAARAGKDIFLQKPLTYTLQEGRILSDTVRRYGRVLQVGSQQRSDGRFRFACELVRNGRIGKLHTVKIGIAPDVAGPVRPTTPAPPELDYDMWLGPAPWADYVEDRVHPRVGFGRPGWLRVSDYCLGMITGWGAHHNDIAQWGMGTEYTGPVEIAGTADYPETGVWDVHTLFRIEYTYAGGVKVICADSKKNKSGVTFEGSGGWVHVNRGSIDAEPKSLLQEVIGPDEIHLCVSAQHKQNFLDSVRSRTEPIAPVEVGHRSCSVCILGHIAMKTGRKLKWDPQQERFLDDDGANALLQRSPRGPWRV